MRNLYTLSLWASTVTAVAVLAAPAQAQESSAARVYNFAVSGGSLPQVIGEISAQARAAIRIDTAADAATRVEGISGQHTLSEALETVLAGTDWVVEKLPRNAYRIVRRDGSGGDIVVTARREDFARTSSSLLTRTDTPLRKTPGTVDSVTEEVLESQNAIAVNEALRNIPGVIFSTTNGRAEAIVRGDTTGGLTYINGLQGSRLASNPPITDIEAIEVLKGPASILTGSSISGGVINFVPKRATGRKGGDVSIGIGSGQEVIASADVGGAILPDQGLYWRLAALSQYADHLPEGGKRPYQRVINPMLGFRSSGIRFDASFQYYDKRTPYQDSSSYSPDEGFRDYGSRLSDETGTRVKSKRGSYSLELDLANSEAFSLTLRNRGLYQEAERGMQYQIPYAYDYFGLGTFTLNTADFSKDQQLSEYLDLYAKFATGPVEHQLILAGDLMHSDTNRAVAQDVGFVDGTFVPSLDLLPVPDDAPRSLTKVRQYGLVVQDQLTLGRLHALLAVRQTFFTQKPYSRNAQGQLVRGSSDYDKTKTLFNGGVVYDVLDTASVYFSYSNAFSATDSYYRNAVGDVLPPSVRTQYEVGVKSGLFNDQLTVNLSAFKYSTDNSQLQDPENPAFWIPGPGYKGKGGEISLSGTITPQLKVLAGYTYTDVKQGDGRPGIAAPRHVANLWAIKTFKLESKDTIDFGFGGNYNSGFFAQDLLGASYPLPLYKIGRELLTVNGSLNFTHGPISVNATVNNILDRRNYQPSSSIGQVLIEAPRTFRITVMARL
ncbi:TonB-dependent receptor [Novosphingobium sp.]|uniref:TonB-dependent siderophore receptor n=1 Tax=Novosphingobium sp. TaxID=1874826 RepID=UPI0028ACF93C|nr:TonB-dependent receptor [Novosphingobium sp.]